MVATGVIGSDPSKLDVAGGTMLGQLVLDDASPAASEEYVADHGGGGGGGSVASVAGVGPDGGGDVPLTPADIGAALASDLATLADGLGTAAAQDSTAFDASGAASTALSTALAAITSAINALNLGTASTHAATDFDATGAASTAQAFAIQRSNHTGTQAMSTISNAGGAATKNVGNSAGTVAAGDDGRFTDARTPTAHASTHATGGTDAVSPSSIGATPTTRTFTPAGVLLGGGDMSANRKINSYGLGPMPIDYGLYDWAFDPQLATSSGSAPTSQLLYVVKFRVKAAQPINNAYMIVGGTGTTPTSVLGGFYDATGTLITGAIGSVVAATWNTVAKQQFALSSGFTPNDGDWLYWAFTVNGATSPTVIRSNTSGVASTGNLSLTGTAASSPATAPRFASANSGITTLPPTLGTLTAVAQSWWAGYGA